MLPSSGKFEILGRSVDYLFFFFSFSFLYRTTFFSIDLDQIEFESNVSNHNSINLVKMKHILLAPHAICQKKTSGKEYLKSCIMFV